MEFVKELPKVAYDGVTPGPKAARTMTSLDLSGLPKKRDWRRVKAFCEQFLLVPAGKGAGQPPKFLSYEVDFFKGTFPAKGERPVQSCFVAGRGAGKSFIASCCLAYLLYADEAVSPQLSIVAQDLRATGHVFNALHRMIATSPELLERTKLYTDKIVVPYCNGLVQPLPANEDALQGYAGTAVVDELAYVDDNVWSAALFGATKIPGSQILAFSTPPATSDSVLWRLTDQARLEPSPDLYFQLHTSDPSHPIDCGHCEKLANPGLGKLVTRQMLATARKSSRPAEYRRMRLAQYSDKVEDKWLSASDLEPVLTDEKISDGARVVCALDGSITNDDTVLTLATVEDEPTVELAAAWVPGDQSEGYRIDPEQVLNAIRDIFKRYDCIELVADAAHFELPLAILAKGGYPVVSMPQNDSRMGAPTVSLYQRIRTKQIKIVRNELMIQHFLNAHFTQTARGGKLHKGPKRDKKIDSAVAAVMATSRALVHNSTPEKKPVQMIGFR